MRERRSPPWSESDLQEVLGRDRAFLLATAEPQVLVRVLVLAHTDLGVMEERGTVEYREGRGRAESREGDTREGDTREERGMDS